MFYLSIKLQSYIWYVFINSPTSFSCFEMYVCNVSVRVLS